MALSPWDHSLPSTPFLLKKVAKLCTWLPQGDSQEQCNFVSEYWARVLGGEMHPGGVLKAAFKIFNIL